MDTNVTTFICPDICAFQSTYRNTIEYSYKCANMDTNVAAIGDTIQFSDECANMDTNVSTNRSTN